MLKDILYVGLGGATGSILRYLTSVLTARFYWGNFPWATFAVNIIGCLLIGIFAGLIAGHFPTNVNLRLLLVTGFCGGYTTFSAFAFENLNLFQYNYYFTAVVYTVLSIALGIAAVWVGLQLTSS